MSQDDVTQIKVDRFSVGIMGLKSLMEEMAGQWADRPDQEVREALLDRLSKKNYIPSRAREKYGKAFLREFKKYLGKPYDEETPTGLEIKVLGPGCVQCDRLTQQLMQVMAETGIMADIEHIRDIKEIGRYGVMGTPALLMNGQVKSVGSVPPKNRIKAWLRDTSQHSGPSVSPNGFTDKRLKT